MSASPIIDVAASLHKMADRVDAIFFRPRELQEDFLANLRDHCDAISVLIRALDNLFIDLVRGFQDERITTDPALLEEHVRQTELYQRARHVSPHLAKLGGLVYRAASDPRLEAEQYRALSQTLRSLTACLEQYVHDLGPGMGSGVGIKKEWDLERLCERALRRDYEGALVKRPLGAMAEEVLRRHDFALSDEIHRLVDQAKQQTRLIVL